MGSFYFVGKWSDEEILVIYQYDILLVTKPNTYTMRKILLALGIFVYAVSVTTTYAASESKPKISITDYQATYKPGDTLEVAWTPSNIRVRDVMLVPTKKSASKYMLHSEKVNSDPVITSGVFEYDMNDYFIPAGTYRVGITLEGTDTVITSSKKIKIESKPSLFFGTKNGEVNSVAIDSGKTVTLQWDAESVKKCEASSWPKNSKWEGSVKASGTKKIRVSTPTTFYINCKNDIGEVNGSFKVDTGAPEYSNATLVPSTTFLQYNFALGTTQQEALRHNQDITLFNASSFEPIYLKINTKNQPAWVNSGYNTAQMTLSPNGVMGLGAFADPSMVTKVGTYKWDLEIEGNFANSPLIIPVTMKVTR